jgi:hypothetical protein
VAVAIVFEPMVPGDDRRAAVAEAGRDTDARLRAFWDQDHVAARAWGAGQRERIVPKLLAQTPADAPWRETLESWDPEQQPLWDAAWFYGPRASWPTDALPEHAAWTKQFDFRLDEQGQASGGFFRGAGWEAEVAWSNWREQFAQGMQAAR